MNTALDTIHSERLNLHRLTEDDAELSLALWNDPDFIRHVGDRGVRTVEEAVEKLREGALKIWDDFGYGPYRLALPGGDSFGICGLFKRENLDHPDIGYALLPAYCGKGYALEAARAVRDHARDHIGLSIICALVSPDHARSIHLLERLGMKYERPIRMPDEDEDILLYGMNL